MSPLRSNRDTWGRLVDLVPSVKIDIFEAAEEEIRAFLERMVDQASGAAIHGARMAGEVLTFPEAEEQPGTWVLVGFAPDGRNCVDCLNLHGTSMTYGVFLDTKYTTRCGGSCRCGFAASAQKGSSIEPLTKDEIQAALDA